MDKRNQRSVIAQETLQISRDGRYAAGGAVIDISKEIAHTKANGCFVPQEQADQLEAGFAMNHGKPTVELCNESTLSVILRLADGSGKLGVLNFASAKNPGGGFLNGAMAQEESLAAASALYVAMILFVQRFSLVSPWTFAMKSSNVYAVVSPVSRSRTERVRPSSSWAPMMTM